MSHYFILYLSVFLIIFTFSIGIHHLNAQIYHKVLPHFQSITILEDRNISINFITEPNPIVSGHHSELKMSLINMNSGEKIQHVTYRITISKDNQTELSEFFHSHTGSLEISSENNNSSSITAEGNFDPLTNAIVPDPSGIIVITGPLFLDAGIYKATIEIITIDNDKTVLPIPLQFHFDIKVKK
jgi:hypothetical protein